MVSIGIIGAGAWGTAMGEVFAKNGQDVLIWAKEADVVAGINVNHENAMYLPKIPLSDPLKATEDLQKIPDNKIILVATPAQFVRPTLEQIKDKITPEHRLVICAKGIELETGLLMSQVVQQVVPHAVVAIMTGPTFARELASGMPGAVTIAAAKKDIGEELQKALGHPGFRPYFSDDIIGAQLGGAIKNVIAIACGVVRGRKMGDSARAALLTRGVAEIGRLGVAMGAKKETLLGMCGIGDLMLTCSSMQSRNFSLGVALGEGKSLDEILGSRKAVTEGVHTVQSTLSLAKKHAVDMPITEAVNKCLSQDASVDQAIEEMLHRPFGYEIFVK